jgi:two-component system, cell cycle sensor histidine kinase and response regulator CckA
MNETQTLTAPKEALYRLVTETMGDLFCIINREGRIVYISPSVGNILGYDSSDLQNTAVVSLVHPADQKNIITVFKRAMAHSYGRTVELRVLHRDGSYRYINASGSWIFDDEGIPLNAVIVCRENVVRKYLEEHASDTENKFRTIFNNAYDAIFLMKGDTIVDCNPSTHTMFRCKRADILNNTPYTVSPPYQPDGRDSKEKALEKIKNALAGHPQTFEWIHKRFDGSLFNAEINLNSMRIGNEVLIQAIVRDISARKTSETELRYRIDFEKLIGNISGNFIKLPVEEIDKGLVNALEDIGLFADVDRAYIFVLENNNTRYRCSHYWCSDTNGTDNARFMEIAANDIPWWNEKLSRFDDIRIADVSQLPAAASKERDLFNAMGVKSVLAVPLRIGNQLIGFLGFDLLREQKNWSMEFLSLLSIVGEILANALERKRSETEMKRLSAYRKHLLDVSRSMLATFDLHEVICQTALVLKDLIPFDEAFLLWDTSQKESLRYSAHIAPDGTVKRLNGERPCIESADIRELLQSGKPVLDNNPKNDRGNIISVPLTLKDKTLGICIVRRESSAFSVTEFELLQLIFGYTTVAIDNALLYREVRQRDSVNSALLQSALSVTGVREVENALHSIACQAMNMTSVDRCAVYMYNGGLQELEPVVVISPRADDESFLKRETIEPGTIPALKFLRRNKKPLILAGSSLTRLIPYQFTEPLNLTSLLIIPIFKNERLYGGIVLSSTDESHRFTGDDARIALGIQNQADIVIDNARLFEALQQKLLYNEALAEVTAALNSHTALNDILNLVLEKMLVLTRAMHGSLMLIDNEKKELYIRSARGLRDETVQNVRLKIGEGIAGLVAGTGQAIFSSNVQQDDRFKQIGQGDNIRSLIAIPMRIKGEVLGVINLDTIEGERALTYEDIHLIEEFVKQAAIAVENARLFEQMRESEERYRRLFEDLKDAVFTTTEEGKLIDINPAGVEMLGYASKDELFRVDIGRDLYVNPSRRDEYRKELKEKGFVKDFEAKLRRKDGKILTFQINSTAVADERTGKLIFRGFLRDVTDQKHLEDQLRQTQKMESLGQLAGGIAHDFNNVLGIIQVSLSSLRNKLTNGNTVLMRYVEMGENAVTRGADVARRLLTFAQTNDVRLTPLMMTDVVKDLTNVLNHTIEKNISIQTSVDENLPIVMGDHGQLYQMFLNLCINARDAILDEAHFVNNGVIGIAVSKISKSELPERLSEPAADDYIKISIADNGCGIPKNVRERIFDPFFTTKAKDKGTGLGLSVVYGIVQAHGGIIDVGSEPGDGTTFTVYLPAAVHEYTELSPESVDEIKGGTERILIVEDEEILRNLLVEILTSHGYIVLTASDGAEGLDLYRTHHKELDAVVLDMGLPKLPGQALFLKIRQINPDPSVILASGYLDEDLKSDLFELGAGAFVAKPYKAYELLKTVRETLDIHMERIL